MEQDGSSFIRYVEALFRSRWLLLFVAGTVFASAVVYAVLAKRQYGSSMKILVQNTRPAPVISGDRETPLLAGGGGADAMEAQINSEVVLLQSADLMEGLVRYRDQVLKHEKPPEEGSLRMAHELSGLEGRIEVTPIRKTNFIQVNFKDSDPLAAQQSLTWLSTAFLDKHAQLRRPAGTFQFFQTQTAQFQKQLQAAQTALIAFQTANSLVSLDKERSLTLDDYNRVWQQIGDAKANLEDSTRRLSSFEQQIASVDPRITTQVRDTPDQYTAEHLDSLLVDLENKRTQLTTRYQDSDPLVVEVDKQIRSTRAAMDRARAESSREKISDNNPIRLTLDQSLRSTRADVSGGQARLASLQAQVKAYAERINALQRVTVQNDILERNVQEAKQNYDTFAQKRDEASIDDELDRSKIADVSIAQEPTISELPVQPHRMMTLLLGGLAACFLGLASVMVKDTMRDTVYTAAELESMVSCPVLATIPEGQPWPALSVNAKALPQNVDSRTLAGVRQA
jgi:uncharacterized protein involved in exopolysaccharide biosynthesis